MQTWHPSGVRRDLSWAIHGRNIPLGRPDGARSHSARPSFSPAARAPPSRCARDAGDTAPDDRGCGGILCAQQRTRHSRRGAPRTGRGHPAGGGATTTGPGAIADVETGVSRIGGTGRAAGWSAAPAPPAAPCRPARRDLSSGSGRKNSFVSLRRGVATQGPADAPRA